MACKSRLRSIGDRVSILTTKTTGQIDNKKKKKKINTIPANNNSNNNHSNNI